MKIALLARRNKGVGGGGLSPLVCKGKISIISGRPL